MLRAGNCALLVMILTVSLAAESGLTSQPTVWVSKPDAAAFEKIVNDRLAAGQSSIDKLLANKGVAGPERVITPH